MRDSVAMASKAGIILAMEIMDTPFVGTILRAEHYLRAIPSPYFKIYPDMGNLTQFSADPESELELGLPEIAAIHVKETKPGVFKCVPFGTGTVRFADLFRKLHEIGYTEGLWWKCGRTTAAPAPWRRRRQRSGQPGNLCWTRCAAAVTQTYRSNKDALRF